MKIRNKLILLIPIFLIAMLSRCTYNVEEELYPKTDCDTDNISYSIDVVPILQNNCYECHSEAVNQAGITLEGYNNLKTYVDNGRFLGAIKHEPGFSPMPQGRPQLPDCQIAKIEQWILDGAQNN